MEKVCTLCLFPKPLDDFSPEPTGKLGRRSQCKTCCNQKARDRWEKNPQHIATTLRRHRQRHRSRLLAKRRADYAANPEKERTRIKNYWKNSSPEKHEKRREYERKFRARPDIREKKRARDRTYQREHRQESVVKHKRWRRKYPDRFRATQMRYQSRKRGASTTEIINRVEIFVRDSQHCHICRKKVKPKDRSLDHLIPLIHGGSHTSLNVALAHRRCNSARGPGRLPAQLRLFG